MAVVAGRSTGSLDRSMTYWDRLWRLEICAALVVFLTAAAMSEYAFHNASAAVSAGKKLILFPSSSAFLTFMYTWQMGTVAAALFGAPLYAALSQAKKATWWYALIVGVTPGIGVLFAEGRNPQIAWFFLALGPIVALVTHWVAAHWLARVAARKHAAI